MLLVSPWFVGGSRLPPNLPFSQQRPGCRYHCFIQSFPRALHCGWYVFLARGSILVVFRSQENQEQLCLHFCSYALGISEIPICSTAQEQVVNHEILFSPHLRGNIWEQGGQQFWLPCPLLVGGLFEVFSSLFRYATDDQGVSGFRICSTFLVRYKL